MATTDSTDNAKENDPSSSSASAPPSPETVLNINLGVLGHVDSGKTSLVKALSTLLSTAALDKSKQSRQRGMTLDLGFSCFFLDEMPLQLLNNNEPAKSQLQITLVDCPGHASLIRTIIGGAQIIDMVLLVVDAVKGWQAQTTECLVLAELTSPNLVIALNKVDQFPASERPQRIAHAQQLVWDRLKDTRFANAPCVGVSACVGGEKVAATEGADPHHASEAIPNETYNMDTLVKVLKESLRPPARQQSTTRQTGSDASSTTTPFYFSIDHCFPIRGRGTVLTGTVLNGSVSVNDMIEFPQLGLQRKVKSMQMFKRSCQRISQGDRAGLCVSNLDAKLIERGTAATPGQVRLLTGAIAVVRKIPYYLGTLKSQSKFHISVGHTTVMATVTFWGAHELAAAAAQPPAEDLTAASQNGDANSKSNNNNSKSQPRYVGSSSLGGDAGLAGLPRIPFPFAQDFVQQDQMVDILGTATPSDDDHNHPLHWALLHFQVPVYCPLESLIIGSRLDLTDSGGGADAASKDAESVTSCRLAFAGRLMESLDVEQPSQIERIRLYTRKERRGVLQRLGDPHRRTDDNAVVRYDVVGADLFKKETNLKVFVGMKVVTERTGDVGEIKSSYGTEGQFRVVFPAGTQAREGEGLLLQFKRYAHDTAKAMHQDLVLPPARPGTRIESDSNNKKKSKNNNKKPPLPKGVKAYGEVVSLKGDVLETNGKHSVAIVSGFFAMEVNIKEHYVGTKVRIPSTKEEGTILGPFGKAGKCKVSFFEGVSATEGSKAELHLSSS